MDNPSRLDAVGDRWTRLAARAPLGVLLCHTVAFGVGLVGAAVMTFTTSNDDERAAWRDAVLAWVVIYDLVAVAAITLVHWLPRLVRARPGAPPVISISPLRTWAQAYAISLPVVFLYVMLFREEGAPVWIIGLTIAVVAYWVLTYADERREIRRFLRTSRAME